MINLLEHLDSVLNIATVDSVLEARGEVSPMLSDLSHTRELLLITRRQVEERELVEIPLLLVRHLNGLVVTMCKSFGSQSAPEVGTVQLPGHLDGHRQVSALQSQIETGLRVLNELQGNLWVSLLLQIRNDALTNQARSLDDLKHLIIVALDQGELEPVFSGVDFKGTGLGVPVKAVHTPALDANKVYGLVKGANDTVVTVERCQHRSYFRHK